MRPRDDELIDPEILEQLDAIDATLAGEPVEPRFAELAELALLLAAARPERPSAEFGARLDRRVAERFGRARGAGGAAGAGSGAAGAGSGAAGAEAPRPGREARRWRSFGLMPALGLGATAVVAVVVAISVLGSGGPRRLNVLPAAGRPAIAASAPPGGHAHAGVRAPNSENLPGTFFGGPGAKVVGRQAPRQGVLHGVASAASSGAGTAGGAGTTAAPSTPKAPAAATTPTTAAPSAPAAHLPATSGLPAPNLTAPAPAPLPNGRRTVQSSILDLGTPARRMDAVAQEVFDVVRSVDAIVQSSNVSSTAGPGASAEFQLRVPSQNLSLALNQLSRLRYANVVSRTDNTTDVNNSYLSLQRQITAAQTALAKLRVKLAAATTDSEIATLHAKISAEQATLARLQGSFSSLSRQISFSSLYVSVQATAGGGSQHGGGFGLHRAAHDALRVLEVTAGAALIALAVLLPLALLAALVWWLAAAAQRRRRERALDMA